MTIPRSAPVTNSVFRADEPVIQSHSLLDNSKPPLFGNTVTWDLNGVVRRPANLPPSRWKLVFSEGLADPSWNLLARELSMIYLNPRHPAVIAAGLSLKPRAANPSSMTSRMIYLRRLARWAGEHRMPPLAAWQAADIRRFVESMKNDVGSSAVRNCITVLRSLHQFQQVLSCGGLRVDPWRGSSARQAAEAPRQFAVSTPVVPPEQWFALIRAAWTYVHTFAPDILRAHHRYTELRANASASTTDTQGRLDAWLADPTSRIPVHTSPGKGKSPATQPNWALLALFLGIDSSYKHAVFGNHHGPGRRRRGTILRAVALGHPTTTGLVDDVAQVADTSSTTGPWHPGLDPVALRRERSVLRNACFVLVVGLSMMRDSEIHEITKGSVVEHYGTPAIASTKQKHDPNLPTKHWWIIEPVAEAIVAAEQVSAHPERVFAPLQRDEVNERIEGPKMLDSFIRHVNATRTRTGLSEIPAGKVRPHMFRRTMAMLTDQFAGSEIALGIQLKHVATRALANRSTQGYAAADAAWAEHLESAIDAARFRRLEDLYATHKASGSIGYGPAAERMARVFDHVQQTVKARNGDATVERTLLRKAKISIRFGSLNHCAFDENNPAGAVCLENAIVPPGHKGPLQDRCRPDRCGNSIIGPEHMPIWDAEKRTLLTLLDTPKLSPCRKAALQRELTDVEAVLRKADKEHT